MNTESKIARMIEAIGLRDKTLSEELFAKRNQQNVEEEVFRRGPIPEGPAEGRETVGQELTLETIVLRTGRPVLAVSNNEPDLTFSDADSEVWRGRLTKARKLLIPAIRAVGRIELENNPRFDWVGTGWLVRPDVVVTNRHVASEFGKVGTGRFVFRQGTNGREMNASIDFLEEVGSQSRRAFRLVEILDIEGDDGPDLAFLRVEGDGLVGEINLSTGRVAENKTVAVIGYPARDSRIPDQSLMQNIFGDVYDKKRLAPGQITRSGPGKLEHDCSTLGGNSGSVVLDLASGDALGIHFAGRFLEANFAVPASILGDRLHSVLKGQSRRRSFGGLDASSSQTQAAVVAARDSSSAVASASLTVSVKVTVEIDIPKLGTLPLPIVDASTARDIDAPSVESAPEDYHGREGYRADFLGRDVVVQLPKIVGDAEDVLEFQFEGKKERELRYQHFSVVMNRKRRMCFCSAVNIDGKLSRRSVRTSWRMDPRIPKNLQIIHECYGNPPKLSRGHMTRREDPVWGNPSEASLGNSDSMHVTNVTPQMQSFNAPIWLGLEDYALQNARQDKMKISVITGPILLASDPLRDGVKIPLSFWKVIVFLHDGTGKLTATGYSISQEKQVSEEEFVFSEYETYQRPLSWIEDKARLSFQHLHEHDPLRQADESVSAAITDFREIRFHL